MMWNITWQLVNEAIGWSELVQIRWSLFPNTEQDKCFILLFNTLTTEQSFMAEKMEVVFSTQNYVYHKKFIVYTDGKYWSLIARAVTMTIFGLCYNVLNKNVCFHARAADWKIMGTMDFTTATSCICWISTHIWIAQVINEIHSLKKYCMPFIFYIWSSWNVLTTFFH